MYEFHKEFRNDLFRNNPTNYNRYIVLHFLVKIVYIIKMINHSYLQMILNKLKLINE